MEKLKQVLDLSDSQLRFLAILALCAVVLSGYLFVRSYAHPTDQAAALPVFLGDSEHEYTGLFVLDPNTAPADSLELLPGIGKVLADRIVTYRQHTHFNEPIDITEVNGIGPKLYERIKPYLRVRK